MSSRKMSAILLIAAVGALEMRAQDSKINSNLGMGVSTPLNPTAPLVGASANAVAGVGYNFDQHHSIVGQFMWSGLPANKDALRPIWAIAGARDFSGHSNLFTLTANYRFQLQGKVFGA